jgi:NhaA family Na+:H+ antiporter
VLVHASGIHATVAGVALGLVVPCQPREGHKESFAESVEHLIRPISAGLAVPVFALLSAGVDFGGIGGLGRGLKDPAAIGVIVGLVAGKAVGILGGTYLVARFTKATLDEDLAWIDVFGLALLGGVGFTVSLLIGELAYGDGSSRDDHIKIAVLAASLLAAVLATVVLRLRNRHYRRVRSAEIRHDC